MALVKVDCTAGGKETCNKHSVSGYPTLKIFRNGEFSQEYNGPREANGNIYELICVIRCIMRIPKSEKSVLIKLIFYQKNLHIVY